MENEFEVTVSQTLVKTTSVFTDNVHQCVERDYDATAGGMRTHRRWSRTAT